MGKRVGMTDESRNFGVRAVWSIVLIALFVLLLLSLLTYNWRDIPINQAPANSIPANLIGTVGAWMAYVLFMLLGVGAYLVPVWFLVFGLLMVIRGARHIRAKIYVAAVFMVAVACLLELQQDLWQPLCQWLNISAPGGVLVRFLVRDVLIPLLGEVGAFILAVTGMLAAAVLFLGMDAILKGLQHFGGACEKLYRYARARLRRSPEDEDAERAPAGAGLSPAKRARLERAAKRAVVTEEETPPPAVVKPARKKPEPSPSAAGTAAASKPAPRPGPADGRYLLPPLDLLDKVLPPEERAIEVDVETTSRVLIETLKEFDIEVEVKNVERGPAVTRYELLPAPGVRVERISSLSNNLALSLKATNVRVQAPIPGKGLVGIEVPNSTASVVSLREILEGQAWQTSTAELPLAVGKDVSGNDIISDLAAMPHLLIAGATGSGKTVCMNSLLAGLLMARTPDVMRLMLIDPKTVEFAVYNNLPHLVGPVITNPRKVALGLQWAIKEMEKRYKIFAKAGVRNIKSFNGRFAEKQGELFPAAEPGGAADPDNTPMPYLVIIADELADLMLTAQAEIENSIARLAQLSRAVGIHMILATQRPSAKVITGTIKANFPTRLAFQVPQMVDSRTILDVNGAEKLLGRGDMLFLPPGSSKLVRAQGTLTSDAELQRIVDFIAAQVKPAPGDAAERAGGSVEAQPRGRDTTAAPAPAAAGTEESEPSLAEILESDGDDLSEDDDAEMLEASVQIIRETHRASTSSLQRRLRTGYTRAARIMDALEARGIVGPARGSDPREILVDLDGEIADNRGASTDAAPPGGASNSHYGSDR